MIRKDKDMQMARIDTEKVNLFAARSLQIWWNSTEIQKSLEKCHQLDLPIKTDPKLNFKNEQSSRLWPSKLKNPTRIIC